MQNRILIFVLSCLLGSGLFLTSCSEEVSVDEEIIGEFVDGSMDKFHRLCRTGKFGCYDFVFPITVEFSDGTTASGDDAASLREAIQAWKESNPDSTGRPDIVFPIEVTTEEGEIVSVTEYSELRDLAIACRRSHRPGADICFNLVYPVEVEFPDGTILEAATRVALKTVVREWKRNGGEGRPSFVFPVEVEYEDGTVVSAASKEELQALREACAEE